jgi:hypothetical protein
MRRFTAIGRPGRAGVWTHFRFNPGVLVILATAAVVFFLFSEAVTAYVFWHYGATYRQVDFVMGPPEENGGYPLVRGLLQPDGVEWVIGARKTAAGYVLESDQAVVIERGRRVRVWWSDAAPVIGFPNGSTKIMPVSTMPRLPGLGRVLGWLATIPVAVLAGMWVLARPLFRSRVETTETLLDGKGET